MKKRILCFALLLLLLAGLLPLYSSAINMPAIENGAEVLIYHNDSGTLLYSSRAHAAMPASPAARLLAAVIFAEYYAENTAKVVSVNRRVTGLATSTMNPGLKGGEQISVYDLLCGMLVASSDDAAYALAFDMFEDDAGAPALLVDKMNEKAADLGLLDSNFADILGAEPKEADAAYSVSSLEDMLTIALEVQKSPLLRQICALDKYTVPATDRTAERLLLTRNYLLSAARIPGYTYAEATGLCAVEGKAFGSCGIFSAEIEGRTFTCIVSGANEQYGAFTDAKLLFEWGKNNFSYRKILDKIEILGEIAVELSADSDYVTLSPDRTLSAFLPNDVDPDTEIKREIETGLTSVKAPVREGLVAGSVRILYNGTEIGRADLITTGSRAMSNSGYYLSLFYDFIGSAVFRWIAIGVLAFFLLYVLINARVRYLRKNKPQALRYAADDDDEQARAAQTELYGAVADDEEPEEPQPAEPQDAAPPPEEREKLPPTAGKKKSNELPVSPKRMELRGGKAAKKKKRKKSRKQKEVPEEPQPVKEQPVEQQLEELTLIEQLAKLEEDERIAREAQELAAKLEEEKAAQRSDRAFYDWAENEVKQTDESTREQPPEGDYVPDGWDDHAP